MLPHRVARRCVAGLALILVLGVGSELGLRTWAHRWRDSTERFDPSTGTYRLVPGRHKGANGESVTINSAGFPGPELARSGADLTRIAALGDSCTFGAGSATDSYPALLQRLIDAQEPDGRRYEVVNAGIAGAHSGDALKRLIAEVMPLEPDVVVVYVGWNDLTKFSPSAQRATGESGWIRRELDALWLSRAVRKLLFHHLRPRLFDPRVGADSRTGRFADFAPVAFETNLREIVRAGAAGGARVLVTTLPTPLREGMSVDLIAERAITFPYFLGSDRVGDFLDLLEAYNQTIRRTAAREAALTIDLARDFDALADATPYFWDGMHTNPSGRALIAKRVFEALELVGKVPLPPPGRPVRKPLESDADFRP